MTPTQINTTIAESMGLCVPDWKFTGASCKCSKCGLSDGSTFGSHVSRHLAVPSYATDLNACAEFEATLDKPQYDKYKKELNRIVYLAYVQGNRFHPRFRDPAHATAPQRCEAYLRTLDLWIE